MFERFTDRARRVVVLAQQEARSLDHNYIGTEHILLGLVHETEGVAAQVLLTSGLAPDRVRQQVEESVGRGQQAPSGHLPFTAAAKKVLELSLRESLQLGHTYIGPEHILLGLLREGDGVGARTLVGMGMDLAGARGRVLSTLQGNAQHPGQSAPAPTQQGGGPARGTFFEKLHQRASERGGQR